jgi:hypothetical protein
VFLSQFFVFVPLSQFSFSSLTVFFPKSHNVSFNWCMRRTWGRSSSLGYVKIKKTQFFFPFPILPFLSDSFFFFSNRTVFLSQFFVFVLLSQFSFSSLKQFFFFFFKSHSVSFSIFCFCSPLSIFVLLSQTFFFFKSQCFFLNFLFSFSSIFFLSFCLSVSQNNVSFLFSQNSVSFFLSFFFFPNRSVSFSIFFIFYFIFILRVMIVNLVIPL